MVSGMFDGLKEAFYVVVGLAIFVGILVGMGIAICASHFYFHIGYIK